MQSKNSKKYRIIGSMTGNSMDAIDLVLTEFDKDKIIDICSYSKPYNQDMQYKMEYLRNLVKAKTREEILNTADFQSIHNEYINQIAEAINDMLQINSIPKESIDAIGFHGKTLDHNPPSVAKINGLPPYTLQIGSGQMLSDLTQIPVIYDFRSIYIKNGMEGSPLAGPHNAHISKSEGDGCYFNGGNTSNFAWIINHQVIVNSDAGPCNEYIDNFIRKYSQQDTYDKDAKFGSKGKLNIELFEKLYSVGQEFYNLEIPKSGDPQFYKTKEIFEFIEDKYFPATEKEQIFFDIIYTLEYFAAYIAFQALCLTPGINILPNNIILFGGGWKNPVVLNLFCKLFDNKEYILPQHKELFAKFLNRFKHKPQIKYSSLGEFMEARLFADIARYKLCNLTWETPEIIKSSKEIVAGTIARPANNKDYLSDMICSAAYGWQDIRD